MTPATDARTHTLRPLPHLLAIAVIGVAACDAVPESTNAAVTTIDTVPAPAATGSGEPNLTADAHGVVYLSWLEPSDAGHALRFARWEGDRWGESRTIVDRPDLFVNWADFPSLALFDDGVMAAHWLQKSGPGTYAYDVRMALSADGGKTWSDDIIPHRDGVEAEHGFVSLVPLGDRLAALWLDGRATVEGHPMTLRSTTLTADGELGPEALVDADVCDCCQTAMTATDDGMVAAYRDRTDDEVRDIYVARYARGEWTEGTPVHDDGWVIAGCPVNGPAVAAHGNRVVVAWFTAAETEGDSAQTREEVRSAGEQGRTLAAFSTDGGATFGTPLRVDDGQAMGRVDALTIDGETAVVSWLERTDDGAEVRVRRVTPTGVGPPVTVSGTAAVRASGFPRMALADDGRIVFAWTATGEDGGVRTAVGQRPGTGDHAPDKEDG